MPRGPGKNNIVPTCGHPDRPNKGRSKCGACYRKWQREEKPNEHRVYDRRAYNKNIEQRRAYARERNLRLKAEIIEVYGGKCACCAETELAFLSIDHIGGWGAEHRREVGKGSAVWGYLRRNGYPKEGLQVLCMNCQFGVRQAGGCPHQNGVENA